MYKCATEGKKNLGAAISHSEIYEFVWKIKFVMSVKEEWGWDDGAYRFVEAGDWAAFDREGTVTGFRAGR